MRVAFDCKGTLLNGGKVLELFKYFESKGCEMYIWSNSYGYCLEAKNKFNLNAELTTKVMMMDIDLELNPDAVMDIAVEDDTDQTWLASNRFIWVKDIPEESSKFDETYRYLFEKTLHQDKL